MLLVLGDQSYHILAHLAKRNDTLAQPSTDVDNIRAPTSTSRPFYAIAHRVLTVQGVKDALRNGANAMEIDARASLSAGWMADHDGSATSAGDTMKELFTAIARERVLGENIIFVWLDIKTPDQCDPDDVSTSHCSIIGLRALARQILEPAGVQVLYGFTWAYYKGYSLIANDLNLNEAVNLDGDGPRINRLYDSLGPSKISKRVMSYGDNELWWGFGDCTESSWYTCTELRQAALSKKFGAVYGWTLSVNQNNYAELMLDNADVDGIIYGFKTTPYYDHPDIREPIEYIKSWLEEHPERRYMATRNDKPW
jgi:sphingomyelin phosphodiesterase D